MAAYAAVVSLMNNIDQMMNHPRLSNSLDKKQIQTLVEKAGLLLDFIESNNYGGMLSKEVEDLERRIACAAHAAEDVIESHIVDRIHAQSSLGCLGFLLEFIKNVVCCRGIKEAEDLQRIAQEMDAVVEKAKELVKEKAGASEEHPRPPLETAANAMVGLDTELTQLMDELTSQRSNRHIISIVGMGGMGKTTLAKNLYQNLLIMEHFDIRAWATISQQYDANEILSQLLSGLGKLTNGNVSELGEQLHKTLIGRRYLIILDDIWSVEAWDKVRRYFPDDGNSSRVLLTTRLSFVASVCGSSCFTMNLLDEDKSWKLFCEKAVFPHKDDPLQLEDVGKKIVRLCKGLALSIVVIAGLLLKSPRTVGFWEVVAENLKSIPNSKEKQESLDVISLSYSHMPSHLKPCFLFMGIYKEDSEIRVSNITKIWVAEGFIKPCGTQVLEEIAEGYLEDLIDRNLILVGRRRYNGKIGSCGIHDLLRDLCVKLAEQQDFFHVRKYSRIRGTERRLVCHMNEQIPLPLARSIFARDFGTANLVNSKLVRVLYDYNGELSPAELYGKVNLRYLAYQFPSDDNHYPAWELPSSVSLIWNLQTLIIKVSRMPATVVAVAPSEIWKMQHLRHVKCKKIYLPHPPLPRNGRDDMLMLENMQRLGAAVNLRLCERVCNIIPNIKNLHLRYDPDLQGYDDSLIECLRNLNSLHKLQSLNLEASPVGDTKLIRILTFPNSLNKLSLRSCKLHWDDLRMIGSLPLLEVLKLGFFSVMEGGQWNPVDGQFLRLKFLKIYFCELRCWNAESCHFPVLEKLHLSAVINLKEIPMDIGEIPTLEIICVHGGSESAAISAIRIKEDQLENQENDALQVQIRVFESEVKSFKERVETEGLTLDHIHLV